MTKRDIGVFHRKVYDKPGPGREPSPDFDDLWCESDEVFRKRIKDALASQRGGDESGSGKDI
jgi:hypothetical protein